MKKMLILVMVMCPMWVSAQKEESDQKLSRQEKKELKKKEEEEAKTKIKELVETQEWVLEVTQLRDKNNKLSFINTANNFVAVTEGKGMMQLNLAGIPGFNDVGIKGNVENYEVKYRGKQMYATGTVNSARGAFTFVVFPTIYNSTVEISGAFNDTITLIGGLVSPEETILFDRIRDY